MQGRGEEKPGAVLALIAAKRRDMDFQKRLRDSMKRNADLLRGLSER
jgi:hypothetical protein